VLHRDIKPSNLLIDVQGTVWVADFGLAYEVDSEDISCGDVVGTLRFIPPERFKQESLPQGDVYSLGLTLYELITLQPAFQSSSAQQLMRSIQYDTPKPARDRPRDPQEPGDDRLEGDRQRPGAPLPDSRRDGR
jgi:eukaryotic-like serine/threonine-protein kinase